MRQYFRFVPVLAFAMIIGFNCFSQTNQNHNQVEKQLIQVVNKWFTSDGKDDLKSFGNLFTDDFQLLALGKRNSKTEIPEMAQFCLMQKNRYYITFR
jgi:hypothetical protein